MSESQESREALAREWARLEEERAQLERERRRVNTVWDGLARLGVFLKDFESGLDRPNNYWQQWGFTREEMRYDGWISKLHPDDRARVQREVDELIRTSDDVYSVEYRILTASGDQRDVLTKGIVNSRYDDGRPRSIIAMDIDVTDLRNAERKVTEAREEAQQRAEEAETLRTIGAVIASALDLEHASSLVLEQIRHVVPYETASVQLVRQGQAIEVVGLRYSSTESIDTVQIREYLPLNADSPQAKVVENGKPLRIEDMAVEFPAHFVSQKRLNHSWLGVPLAIKGEIIGLLALEVQAPAFFTTRHLRLAMNLVDYIAVAIQNAKAYNAVQEQAATDPLTGLRTRRWFFEHGDALISQALRYDTPLAILITDVDHFKRINDQYGHLNGDRVLRALASIFLQEMRSADAICRYGGEEFAVLLPQTDMESAVAIAERLRRRASEVTVEKTGTSLSVSIGVTTAHHRGARTLTDLIAGADEALYRAKQEGRNRVCKAS
jgi:diguanylate cyclase (GGDEF)-like protein/PAS domain S-box-containing protein